MQQNGRLWTCDRCGAQHFSKTTGEGETDGGYTRWNKFEEPPDLWGLYTVGMEAIANGSDHRNKYAHLCPACAKEWQRVMNQFMENVEEL